MNNSTVNQFQSGVEHHRAGDNFSAMNLAGEDDSWFGFVIGSFFLEKFVTVFDQIKSSVESHESNVSFFICLADAAD